MTASYSLNKNDILIVVKIYLSHLPNNMSDRKPSLLVAKGNINRMGGAERDLIRCLPHLQQWYDVSVATLNPSTELSNICRDKDIKIFAPPTPWHPPNTPFSPILDGVHTS